jgi:hypothetical protein
MYEKKMTSKYCLNKKSPNRNVWALNNWRRIQNVRENDTLNIVQKKSTKHCCKGILKYKWRRLPYVRENDAPIYRIKKKHKHCCKGILKYKWRRIPYIQENDAPHYSA